ncbi:ubiquitin-conjugating enzyme [Colletotrichum limetticola]|uniref:Ubiquitin-conjugating enzyme n=1 Tax=Colletotrichum limetticola TaxID=1209924 RepID=A0ABQ9PBD2_9PEZI|nr:ubiquitin-conjugating enzyme [Colletotrichum limetticola]
MQQMRHGFCHRIRVQQNDLYQAGGRKGNCPRFDDVETRHNKEVQQAEAKAHQKILEHKANSAPTVPKKNRSKMRAV